MIIDFHTHVADLRPPGQVDLQPVGWDDLLRRLDQEGIDRAVFLPLGASPESVQGPFLFASHPDVASQLREALRRRDRVIPFGNLDPRMGCLGNLEPSQVADRPPPDFSWVLDHFVELGCAGIGEVTAAVAMDDPRLVVLCRQCGERGLPVLAHCTGTGPGVYGLQDEAGSPRLENLLRQIPHTLFIGHATGFWAEISAEAHRAPGNRFLYPAGPVEAEGSLPRLLRTYPNLYADLSARSGLNAISRDRAYGARFLEEFQDRLLFGTDVCFAGPQWAIPTLAYLRELLAEALISREAFAKITGGNALRVLRPGAGAGRPLVPATGPATDPPAARDASEALP